MRIKTADLTGPALDGAVAKCETPIGGYKRWVQEDLDKGILHGMNYSTDWSLGGPIIERERITLVVMPDGTWQSQGRNLRPHFHNPTPLIAAMRCYVASKLGEDVDIPDELLA